MRFCIINGLAPPLIIGNYIYDLFSFNQLDHWVTQFRRDHPKTAQGDSAGMEDISSHLHYLGIFLQYNDCIILKIGIPELIANSKNGDRDLKFSF